MPFDSSKVVHNAVGLERRRSTPEQRQDSLSARLAKEHRREPTAKRQAELERQHLAKSDSIRQFLEKSQQKTLEVV